MSEVRESDVEYMAAHSPRRGRKKADLKEKREDLFVSLLLRWLSESITELGKHRRRDTVHRDIVHSNGVAPVGSTRWLGGGLHAGRLRVDAGILEDIIQEGGRSSPNILGDTGDRWGRAAGENESADKEEHEEKTALGRLFALGKGVVLVLLSRDNGHLLLDLGLDGVVVKEVGCVPGARHAHTVHVVEAG
ncbi:hypothetical protein HG530_004849 [Fusarium avenaceum]|nr:hypothetical protein HG530_004849 [Fusarium avenaceum]